MQNTRKNFIPKNDGFVCNNCGLKVPPAKGTFRNHCTQCLASKHVDQDTPGDRLAACHGLMPATGIEGTDPDKLDIIHTCSHCGKKMLNKAAVDDSKDALFALMKNQA
ncbi:MAG: RNHCP domain-containing protein [Candidatus Andersenbacteria bacterium]|nr:RNHCP domain-containing protein [Candidatus Andersenbacteria bacterium]